MGERMIPNLWSVCVCLIWFHDGGSGLTVRDPWVDVLVLALPRHPDVLVTLGGVPRYLEGNGRVQHSMDMDKVGRDCSMLDLTGIRMAAFAVRGRDHGERAGS